MTTLPPPGGRRRRLAAMVALASAAAAAAPPVFIALARLLQAHQVERRLDTIAAFAAKEPPRPPAACVAPPITDLALARRIKRLAPLLASWETVGGCGAGASTGAGASVKWIGRNVTGGLFHVECQANYIAVPYGYNYIATALVSRDIAPRWNLGVSVPFVYKYMNDPYALDVDVSNHGLGDLNVLLTRRFGAINNWRATLSAGAPTGIHDAAFRGQRLPQERQLGLGRPTASLVLDHITDTDWGLILLGGSGNWRGGQNAIHNYRGPSASLYGYLGYTLGPFVPAAGLSVTAFAGRDRNNGGDQGTPLASVAANVSLEWATDKVAVLVGASLPYDHVGGNGAFGDAGGLGAWVLALGLATEPF